MQCISPLKAGYNSAGDLVYRNKGWSQELVGIQFPCRKCLPCLLNGAREKATRCWHESRMWSDSIFLTLTYDDAHLPGERLFHADIQNFLKSLREKRLRYVTDPDLKFQMRIPVMYTGEYGEENKRPHWHALLFNYRPKDAVYKYTSDRGDDYYESQEIDKLWKRGTADFSEVTLESAGYVARYGAKALVHGKDAPSWMRPIHKTSSRYGIGRSWIEKYWKQTFDNGFINLPTESGYVRGKIPRYYVDWLKKHQPDAWVRYVTEVRVEIMSLAERKARIEEVEYLSEYASAMLDSSVGIPLSRSKVKQTILSRKFKQLQEKLKL